MTVWAPRVTSPPFARRSSSSADSGREDSGRGVLIEAQSASSRSARSSCVRVCNSSQSSREATPADAEKDSSSSHQKSRLRADVAGRDEDGRGKAVLLEERLGDQEVVAVAVVERDDDGARAAARSAASGSAKLPERHDAIAVAEKLHLLGEEIRGDAQVPRGPVVRARCCGT